MHLNPGGRQGNPLLYSCLKNSMDRGAWRGTVHGICKELDTTEWLSMDPRKNSLAHCNQGFPGGSDSNKSACNAGDMGSSPGSGRFPWRREMTTHSKIAWRKKWQTNPVFLPRESHGQRATVHGVRESDTTQQLTYTMPLKSWSAGKVRRKELSGDRNMGQKAEIIVQSLSCVQFFVTPWTPTCQTSLSFTISCSLLKLISIKSLMPSNQSHSL